MKIALDDRAYMPTRAHPMDAGIDLYAMDAQIVPAGGSAYFDTGVHVEIPLRHVGLLQPRSGLNVKQGILSHGVIDTGYTGTIKVKLYNLGTEDYHVERGDRITQLIVVPISLPEMYLVGSLDDTDRGDAGIGSSGR